jgi:hypothetical protein
MNIVSHALFDFSTCWQLDEGELQKLWSSLKTGSWTKLLWSQRDVHVVRFLSDFWFGNAMGHMNKN